MLREFSCSAVGDINVPKKVITAKKPKQAASKAFTRIAELNTNIMPGTEIIFCITEKSKGKNCNKDRYYVGKRIQLDEPEIVKVNVKNKETGLIEQKEITYSFINDVRKYDKPLMEINNDDEENTEERNYHCILNNYIDFNELANNSDESICGGADEPYFLIKSDDNEYLVDSEIKKYDKKKINSIDKMIRAAKLHKYKKYEEKLTLNDKSKIESVIDVYEAYQSTDNEYILFVVMMHSSEMCMLGLICNESQKYVFLGCAGSHPFIATYDFMYGNSDGSGPFIKDEMDEKYDEHSILGHLKKYYKEFVSDSYH